MVKLDIDQFLSNLDQFTKKQNTNQHENKSIYITIKRNNVLPNDKFKKSGSYKKQKYNRLKVDLIENPEKQCKLLFKGKFMDRNASTLVEEENIPDQTNQLLNVFRLHFLLKPNLSVLQSKKIKKPTPPNSKSKSQLKKQNNRLRNKERRQKRAQIKKDAKREKQKQIQLKLSNKGPHSQIENNLQ